MIISSFGIIGTAICPRLFEKLIPDLALVEERTLTLDDGVVHEEVLNATISPLTGLDAEIYGKYYEKYIV